MKDWFKELFRDKFKRYLILALIITGIVLLIYGNSGSTVSSDLDVHYFYQPSCHFCALQKPVNEKLMEDFPNVNWVEHDITKPQEAALFREFASKKGIALSRLGTPTTFIGEKYFIGFNSDTSEENLRSALANFSTGQESSGVIEEGEFDSIINVPFFGEIDVLNYSLPVLSIVLGFIDGFNPCAMWVLVYLISLIISINDKRKIWLLVGSFVFASGVLYFLFMTAWLNVFLLIGYLRPVTLVIGLFALAIGVLDVRTWIKTKGALACPVGDVESKKRTMSRMKDVVLSPLSIGTVFGIIALAFVVNSIEFVCSAAIPAIFTQVLALSNLSGWQYYGYILLYDFFFILDDLVIFGLAALAVNTSIGDRYAKHCKLIGGAILIILGILLTFAPGVLR